MTAPLFLVGPEQLRPAADREDGDRALASGATVEVTGSEARHAVAAMRLGPGEQVLLGDGAGRLVEAVVESVTAGSDPRLLARVLTVTDIPQRRPRFVLAQALAKGDRDEQAIETATELGVDEVLPWQAARSVVQWRGDREQRSRRKWSQLLAAASKQSRRARIPLLGPTVRTADLAGRAAGACMLVLHEEADTALVRADLPAAGTDKDLIVVVGPEGGIAPHELDVLVGAGAQAVRLGPEVLRASSAGPASLAILSARLRW